MYIYISELFYEILAIIVYYSYSFTSIDARKTHYLFLCLSCNRLSMYIYISELFYEILDIIVYYSYSFTSIDARKAHDNRAQKARIYSCLM